MPQLTSMHFYAWEKGLKTGMYYLRTRPKADAIQFTVDQTALKQVCQPPRRPPPVCRGPVSTPLEPAFISVSLCVYHLAFHSLTLSLSHPAPSPVVQSKKADAEKDLQAEKDKENVAQDPLMKKPVSYAVKGLEVQEEPACANPIPI